MRDQPITSPPRNPSPTATSTTPTSTAVLIPVIVLAARPMPPGPVVATNVCASTSDSFQMAVLRSAVNRAPSADVISCGRVRANVIVINDANEPGAGFDVDTNAVTIVDRRGRSLRVPLRSKAEVADAILDAIETYRE